MSSEIQELTKAIRAQTVAISALVESNQKIIALLTDVVGSMIEEDEDRLPGSYLDGSPRG